MSNSNVQLGKWRRPTNRGVRRCPQCGTLNGTRGLSCKNRKCDMLFETAVAKRGIQAATRLVVATTLSHHDEDQQSAVEEVIGPNDDVFSVKLKSRANPEHRGFVKIRRSGGAVAAGLERPGGSTDVPVCVSCNLSDCVHVAACTPSGGGSLKESSPLPVKQSVLNSMSISGEWKHKIWLTARDYGPLAQRVSNTTMVVKCDPDEKHRLGYLHTTFILSGETGQQKFRCDCSSEQSITTSSSGNTPSSLTLQMSNSTTAERCIHFYSCLAVFLSDQKLSKEFDTFVQDDQIVTRMLNSIRSPQEPAGMAAGT